MPFRARLSFVTVALIATASMAGAQENAIASTAVASPAVVVSSAVPSSAVVSPAGAAAPLAGPLAATTRAGLRAHATTSATREVAELQPDALRKRGMPQMIIGGAALVGGLIIGDDVGSLVALGGLGFGLYGLYLYLQ